MFNTHRALGALRTKLRTVARWVQSRTKPGPLVLAYHRVTDLPFDPHLLAVTPERFREHLQVLNGHARPLSLNEVATSLRRGEAPDRGVVLTFDDGYADNLHEAKPLLEKFNTPATVFVATGYFERPQEFWWDELEGLLLHPGKLPGQLVLQVGGERKTWQLNNTQVYTQEDYNRLRGWNVRLHSDPTPRHRLYRDLHERFRNLSAAEQSIALDGIRHWSGKPGKVRDTHARCNPKEVVELAQGSLVEVGAHTVTHPALSTLPREAQQVEIQRSKDDLEELLGQPVRSFSYPFGTPNDYARTSVELVKTAGFTTACINSPGLVRKQTDPYCLPRVIVRNWTGEQFLRLLKLWGVASGRFCCCLAQFDVELIFPGAAVLARTLCLG
jgi:peptidoglycan/xylan/chitin deacetylase (PgdA/CDA1 family)